jgi:hypothetical protein
VQQRHLLDVQYGEDAVENRSERVFVFQPTGRCNPGKPSRRWLEFLREIRLTITTHGNDDDIYIVMFM